MPFPGEGDVPMSFPVDRRMSVSVKPEPVAAEMPAPDQQVIAAEKPAPVKQFIAAEKPDPVKQVQQVVASRWCCSCFGR